jgi:hypothetical protein
MSKNSIRARVSALAALALSRLTVPPVHPLHVGPGKIRHLNQRQRRIRARRRGIFV